MPDDSLLPYFCHHLLGGLEKCSSQENHETSSMVPEDLVLSEVRKNLINLIHVPLDQI